jgi:hypothetical protein
MDRAIFHLRTSVAATSLYLLICSLLDEGQAPTLDRTKVLWNGTEEELNAAMQELIQRGILIEPRSTVNGRPQQLDLTSNWRRIV